MKSTKVLITGAGGFLGSYIARELIKKNYQVYSFSRSEYSFLKELGVTQRTGDLKNFEDVKLALNGMDAVIHTASLVGMWGRYADYFATNVTGTENVLAAMKEQKIQKLVYTSTPSGLLAVALRPHLIFGPGDMNLVPRVIEAQKKGRLRIIGDGENLVDVLYVENAAAAHVMALEKLAIGHAIVGKAYFLGQGPIKLWDFTNTLLRKAGLPIVTKKISLQKAYSIGFIIECLLKITRIYNIHPPMTRFVALQLGKSHYFSHHKLETDLEFVPNISIDEGINRLFL